MAPKLVKYSAGYFKLVKENLPESIKNNEDLHNRLLIMLQNKYANHSWGSMLPEQRFEEMNEFIFSLVKEYFN